MNYLIKSPLINNENAKHIYDITTEEICSNYRKELNIEVNKTFTGLKKISLYKCIKSGYCFFFPLDISGDSSFYEKLQNFSWYYMAWKWEHEFSLKFINKEDRVLEVGCAKGDFLLGLRNKMSTEIYGIELNQSTNKVLEKKGIIYSNLNIQEYSKKNFEYFDVVCSFQVLEHISEVYDFVEAKIACLKKGGKLIISVPNNDSFIKWSNDPLNMPPHHMGMWNKKSLKYLSKIFNLTIEFLQTEPLQAYHIDWYYNIVTKKFMHPFFIYILSKSRFNILIKFALKSLRNLITGHTIIIVLKK